MFTWSHKFKAVHKISITLPPKGVVQQTSIILSHLSKHDTQGYKGYKRLAPPPPLSPSTDSFEVDIIPGILWLQVYLQIKIYALETIIRMVNQLIQIQDYWKHDFLNDPKPLRANVRHPNSMKTVPHKTWKQLLVFKFLICLILLQKILTPYKKQHSLEDYVDSWYLYIRHYLETKFDDLSRPFSKETFRNRRLGRTTRKTFLGTEEGNLDPVRARA